MITSAAPLELGVQATKSLLNARLAAKTGGTIIWVAAEKQPETEEIQSAPPIVVEMPAAAEPAAPTPKRKRQPKGYPHLVLAREHRDARRTNDALTEYDYLVLHAPRLVNDVIEDLEMLTAGVDAPLEAHRILGDAYTRADRLAEALQRYQYVLERTAESSTSNL